MKIRFKRSNSRESYWSEELYLRDNDTAEVSSELANKLLRSFPSNFKKVGPIQRVAPVIPRSSRKLFKLQFKASSSRMSYWSEDLRIEDGETIDLDWNTANKLLKAFPENFQRLIITIEEMGPPLHKPLKLSDITILTVQYWPDDILKNRLLSNLPKQVEFIKLDNKNNKNWTSMAEALNYGIRKAKNDTVICAHSDMIFKKGWFESFVRQECRLKKWGALGIVGMSFTRETHWGKHSDGPYKVASLDECCLIMNRRNGIWFDARTFKGFHCYGVDFCLQCRHRGLGVYVLSGPAVHAGRGGRYPAPKAWLDQLKPTQRLLKRKWEKIFPIIMTTTGVLSTTPP